MNPPPPYSIKRKLMTVIMLASVAVLLLTVAAFMVYDLVTFRQAMARNLVTQGRMLAENSTSSLAFLNEGDATNALASLRNDPHIIAAALYDDSGKLFEKYPAQTPDSVFPAAPGSTGYRFENSYLTVFEPAVEGGKQMGTLYLQSDLTALTQRFELYLVISLMIMLGALLVAFLISNILQKRISDPIIALADTARKISAENDYSLRAPRLGEDELGLLSASFNTMLERIQASDRALRASEAQFRLVTDQARVSLAHMDRDCRYKFANQPYAERYGRKIEEIVGRPATEVVGAALFAKAWPYIEKALAGQQIQFEFESTDAQGKPRWSHAEYTPERNAAGEVVGFVATHTDITQRKEAEFDMARARDQALAASRAKDDFLAALSHELRTPLNPVLLVASDSAGNPELPAETRAVFEMIRRNVELEARLIDDLLDLTRVTRGKLLLDMQPVEIGSVLRDATANVQAEAQEKHISLACHWAEEPLVIVGDAVRLQQIFWNVLKNAVKFTAAEGRITLEARATGGMVAVTVADTGIGMTAAEISQVFNAFSQGDHAGPAGSHQFGGLGLGLAISHSLVEMHGGTIRATSPGRQQGSTFIIEFPLGSAAGRRVTPVSFPPAIVSVARTSPRRGGVRILLVEDHGPTRIALTHLLTRRHYCVLAAASVAEARALVSRETFDLVVSDIGLPDGDGYTLMAELRDRHGLTGIALTGYGMDQDIDRARTAGFVSHLTKPVRVESLEQALIAAV